MTNVEIKMNDGIIRNVSIKDYDPEQIAEDLNNPDKNMMALGNVVVQRYSVVRIIPVDEVEEEKDNN